MTIHASEGFANPAADYWERLGVEDRLILGVFFAAKTAVVSAGFQWEIEWQEARSIDHLDESQFLREAAWVILSSGMKEAVVARVFDRVVDGFGGLVSGKFVVQNRQMCIADAARAFAHRPKLEAIAHAAGWVAEIGIDEVRDRLRAGGAASLTHLPYIGPKTSAHLAKNLGVNVAKADRHLSRLAGALAFCSPSELCNRIAGHLNESTAVVDVILWRACVLGALRPH